MLNPKSHFNGQHAGSSDGRCCDQGTFREEIAEETEDNRRQWCCCDQGTLREETGEETEDNCRKWGRPKTGGGDLGDGNQVIENPG